LPRITFALLIDRTNHSGDPDKLSCSRHWRVEHEQLG
jgi:hypothetical protein